MGNVHYIFAIWFLVVMVLALTIVFWPDSK